MNKALLLSVKEVYAEKIFEGSKTVELRRRQPHVTAGDYLIVYVPAPQKCVAGVVTVERVLAGRLKTLWRKVRAGCGLSRAEYQAYFAGAQTGYAILVGRPARLAAPVPLSLVRRIDPGFTPQGYKYLSRDDIWHAIGTLRVHRAAL